MKILLISSVLLSTASTLVGQGYVNFANTAPTRVSTNGTLQAASLVGDWYYALLIAPSTQSTDVNSTTFNGWTLAAYGTNTATAGRLTGNNFDSGTAVAITVPGYSSGSAADFLVVGWSGNLGRDWDAVRAGWHGSYETTTWTIVDPSKPGGANTAYFGWSTVANDVFLQPAGSPYNPIFGSAGAGLIPGLNLRSIPEPSSMAFSALCATGLMIWRRRKSQ